MERTIKLDPFFDKQPELSFIEELKRPLHAKAPKNYGNRPIKDGEFEVGGIYIAKKYPDDPENLLETVYTDLDLFFKVYGIGGERYPIVIKKGETEKFEAHIIEITPEGITITANDTEGVRRALIYIEDELRRREGAYLEAGTVKRAPHITARITRCFFSPINRPPKYGDELTDDIDYYPEEYLNRLMHDGANGVWIYTRFSDLFPSSFITEYGNGYESRIAKLNRVVEKCRRYGIGVHVFAIEPMTLPFKTAYKYSDMCGVPTYEGMTFCPNTEKGKAFCREAGEKLMTLVPKLAGYISITYGERITSCATAKNFAHCPRCGVKPHGQALSDTVEALRSGIRAVNPDCKTVSWTYGARTRMERSDDWKRDIRDYVRYAPDDVMLMQNFDDMGYEEQLGKLRQGEDYWMSYIGPSELFRITAEQAKISGKHMYAKMQVCCSHEIASVPYVPVPGIIYKKYKAAHELGVEGVMQCWYFGNYPSIMSKAAGELAFESFENETDFLTRLAAIYWGNTKAPAVVRAWEEFEAAYRNYPLNIMFSYYGPAHDGVVWKLALKPKNFSLARSWQGVDPVDGDRLGEALLNGHTLDEAFTLVERMSDGWHKGAKMLREINIDSEDETEQVSIADTIELLFDSTRNILEFYKLRDMIGRNEGNATELLARMRSLVEKEIENSLSMIPLCENDGRLGYHSEAEGYKFFPAKLLDRVDQLRELLDTEFAEVSERIDNGLIPLEYYAGIEDAPTVKRYTMSKSGLEGAEWTDIEDGVNSRFRIAYDDENLTFEFMSDKKVTFTIAPEFRLFHPDAIMLIAPNGDLKLGPDSLLYNSLFGESEAREYAKYEKRSVIDHKGSHIVLTLSRKDIGLETIRPFKFKVRADDVSWCKEEEPTVTLGKLEVSPLEYGWILP